MRWTRFVRIALTVALLGGCAATTSRLDDARMSGFLESYQALEPVERGFLYTNPAAKWASYGKVQIAPVTIWRAGANALDGVHEDELVKVATMLDRAVRDRLSKSYEIVDEPGPGVMRLSLAITQAVGEDAQISIVTADVSGQPMPVDEELSAELEAFADVAMIELEARDASTRQLLAAAVDTYVAPEGREKGSAADWDDVAEGFAWWADRLADWLDRARSS